VSYIVAPNTKSASRSGTIWAAGKTLALNQIGVTCALNLSSRNISVPPNGVTGSALNLTANAPDCQWTATANVPWILVSSGPNGSGTGTVSYTVGVNTGALRTGTMTVGGQTVYLTQAGAGGSLSTLASVTPGGVVNGASGASTITPGGFVAIYGQNFADPGTGADWSLAIQNGRLPTSVAGASVTINGKPSYVNYVSPTQINALAPPDTATGSVDMVVATSHGTSVAPAMLATSSPGLFAYSLSGTSYAAAVFASDGAYVAASGAMPGVATRPARPGDNIVLFATGLGQTNPAYPAGQVLTTAYPIANLSQLSVLIGGQPATVQYAGMTFAGMFQINVQLPVGIPAGDQSIVMRVGTQSSQSGVYLTCGGS
jgi:uncharacterized protein (TIGR03437 family)